MSSADLAPGAKTDTSALSRFVAAVQMDRTMAYILLNRAGKPIWASPTLFELVALDLTASAPLAEATHPEDLALCNEVFKVEQDGAADNTFTINRRFELVVRLRSPHGGWRRVALRLMNLVDEPDVRGYLLQLTLANQELNTVAAFDAAASGEGIAAVLRELLATIETGGTGNGVGAVFDQSGTCLGASPEAPIMAGDERSDPRWGAAFDGHADMVEPIVSSRNGTHLGTLETCSAFPDLRPFTAALTRAVARRIALVLDNEADRRDLVRNAAFDALTGLQNRWSFRESFRKIEDNSGISVVFIDIDQFKLVNDTFGHDAGDAVLVEVARRLQQYAEPSDLLARLGGDEFVLVRSAPAVPPHEIAVADIAGLLSVPVEHDSMVIPVSCSVGVARGVAGDRRDLIARADAAMYEAKRPGRNCLRDVDVT